MPAPRVGHCLFCDDVRFEVGFKHSFMGVYDIEMVFPAPPPALLPKLYVVAWLVCDIDDIPQKAVLTARYPLTDVDAFSMELVPNLNAGNIPVGSSKYHLQAMAVFPAIILNAGGDIEVFMETELGKNRIGRLTIRFPDMGAAVPTPLTS